MLMQRYSPNSGLGSELGHLFGDALRNGSTFDPWGMLPSSRLMPASVEETQDGVVVKIELPGVDPKLIDVQVAAETLTISVEKTVEGGEAHADGVHRFGSFRQSISLPVPVDPALTDATSEHGVLKVVLKKAADAMPKRITVKAL